MGGEKARDRASVVMVKGSPPRGRGKGEGCPAERAEDRITPAWAGKRDGAAPTGSPPRDHPRVGGEKEYYNRVLQQLKGSPPRRRGKGHTGSERAGLGGITPAWAGKSRHSGKRWPRPWDHPRVGGKKKQTPSFHMIFLGSPPHGRGKGVVEGGHVEVNRITPAWAGKSMTAPGRSSRTGDHPRVGGEKPRNRGSLARSTGSPPRRRGKARHLSHGLLPCG